MHVLFTMHKHRLERGARVDVQSYFQLVANSFTVANIAKSWHGGPI